MNKETKRAREEDCEASLREQSDGPVPEDPFEDVYEDEVFIDAEEGDLEEPGDQESPEEKQVWTPGSRSLGEDETLVFDSSAYAMFHQMQTEWPCLSFDVLIDSLGWERKKFPHTLYLVAGTQAVHSEANQLVLMKTSQLHRTTFDDADSEDEPEESLDEDPILEFRSVQHPGGVNKVRSMKGDNPGVVASWSDLGNVHVWNLKNVVEALDEPPAGALETTTPIQTFEGHSEEGWALDWSPLTAARLLSGDNASVIRLWEPQPAGVWLVDRSPFVGHTSSVEDLKWSPAEADVFASCSADKTIKIWDARVKERCALSVQAHECDVNVISWHSKVHYLMASGADDGTFSIWDLRHFSTKSNTITIGNSGSPAAHFKWHNAPITSLEWHPTDDGILAVSGDDNQITTWDLALEADANMADEKTTAGGVELPPQLYFIHEGQREVKEVHWHPQLPGVLVSTGATGMHIYQSINMLDD